MYFKNDKHKALFKSAIKKMDKKDNVQMCIVYLLTAERKLWNKCRIYMMDNKIPIHRVRVGKCTGEGYALFCCAKDLGLGTTHLTVKDLSDREVVSATLWKLIYTAMDIRRIGLSRMLYYKGEDE